MRKTLKLTLTLLLAVVFIAACTPNLPENGVATSKNETSKNAKDDPQLSTRPPETLFSSELIEGTQPVNTTPVSEQLTPTPQRTPVMKNAPAVDPPSPDVPDQREVVAIAVEKLAEELWIPPEHIQVIAVQPARWHGEQFGCGSQGARTSQEIVRGYAIVLEAEGGSYLYHSDLHGTQGILCPSEQEGALRSDLTLDHLILAAKRDLARRLDISTNAIELLSIERILLPDNLECSPLQKCPDIAYPGPRFGYRILLQAEGRCYEYLSDPLGRVRYQE